MPNFVVNTADLYYILRQIKISEATSVGYTPAVAPVTILQAIMNEYGVSAANAAQLPAGMRTVDGSFNNLMTAPTGVEGTSSWDAGTSEFGAADNMFPRLTDPVWGNDMDGDSISFGPGSPTLTNTNYAGSGNVVDADPRIISNLIVDMSVNNPAAVSAYLNNPISLAQFEADHPGMIPVAPDDPNAGSGDYLAITDEDLQTIPNQSPDVGLTAGFNSWMTYFGQFFDHGLDLVTKGNAGTVYIPLQADDPLIAGGDLIFGNGDDLPAHLRFMALTRATQTLDANGIPQHENTTTSFIDQNQTYTSHSSHQVFLREYVKLDLAGDALGPVAVSTGRLLDGTNAGGISVNGAIGNWAEVKAQALAMLGIRLDDFDVHNVPLLLTDQYGKFIPGASGYAQMVMAPDATHAANWLKEGTAAGITTAGSIGTGHAFLNDIAHHAAPAMVDDNNDDRNNNGIVDSSEGPAPDVAATPMIRQVADSSAGVGDDGNRLTYDDEMLNAHFITGDGRGNENIALTAVHSIFHSEHNRLVEDHKATILENAYSGTPESLAFLNEWLLVDVTDVPSNPSSLVWDGDRLFQAARFSTEMQYQHLVFEEFARRIQPMIDPFVFNNSPEIDASIVAEFAHTVYRFGHSMLTGTVDRLENDLTTVNGDADQESLLAVFLNPQAYVGSGATLEEINANIVRGLSRDVGNAMDEFIVTDVRSNLLGLPLDLGALNIARGRDTGIPSLNETRRQLYNDSGLADLKPYDNWADFASHIKNAASVVNFIAAYGTHPTITAATTLAGKRAAAELIVFGGDGAPADRLAFINATGAYAPDGSGPNDDSLGGLNYVDLWIGGLAEANPEFGGMLGSTFNYVFEAQMENLQNGDRMYYLTRTQGLNFLNQLEPNTFADMVMRNTDLGDQYATHLSGQLFVTPDLFLEMDRGIAQEDYNGSASGRDPGWADGEPHSPFDLKVEHIYSGVIADGNHDFGGTLRFKGGEHVVVGGTEGADRIYTDLGDDTLWGDGGDDYLNGGSGAEDVFGGTGDDIIEDPFGDDLLRGQAGNDVISGGRGFDILFGNEGSDAIFIGQDASEVFAGADNDFILGGAGSDAILGNEGDDWIEGGAGFDGISGDNSELFFNSTIIGHDVMFAQADETDYDAESGDDIMGSGTSVFRYEGMFGFDWAIGKGENAGVAFDMAIKIFTAIPNDILRDRFDGVEALSGHKYNDVLEGDSRGNVQASLSNVGGLTGDALFVDDILKQEGIDRIAGFGDWFQGARATLFGGPTPLVSGTEVATSFRDGNILMGGDGNDTMSGRGGFDLLDGDAYLNVRIAIVLGTGANAQYYSAESLNSDTSVAGPYAGKVYRMVGNDPEGEVDFAGGAAFGGRSLTSLLLDRTINPAQMSIVREIKYDATNLTGPLQNYDTAVFFGTLAEYDIEGRTVDAGGVQLTAASDVNGDGFISVHDRDDGATGATVNGVTLPSRRLLTDDTDLLRNIEELRFADQTLILSGPHMPQPPALDLNAFNVVTTQYRDEFTDPVFNNSSGSSTWTTSWVETNDGTNTVTGGQIRTDGGGSNELRFQGVTDSSFNGAEITRSVNLSGLGPVTLSYSYAYTNIDSGETLTVEFSANGGASFTPLQTISGGAGIDATLAPTTFSTTVTGGANSLLRFSVSGMDLTGENFRIDNVNFVATVNVPEVSSTGYTSTFTEGGAAAAIASNSAITDVDSVNMVGAQIRLTNALSEDLLSIAGALPAGITSSFGPIEAGKITLILSGTASLAAYTSAIQQVRFSSTSQNPVVTPRIIEVSVRDAQGVSPVAIATVNVVAVNDAPVAVADTILTNISSGAIVIPEWALLANDTDVEANVLDVSAVSAATGVTALSLGTNPGSVTLSDDATAGGSFAYTANDGLGGTSNATVTLTNLGFAQFADNFNGVGAVRSAANNSSGTVAWSTSWIEANDTANLQTGQIQIDGGNGNGTNQLRFSIGDGGSITRAVDLSAASSATLAFTFDKNGIDVGESVQVLYSADGSEAGFVLLATITNGINGNGNAAGSHSLALTGGGANSAIRFVTSAINLANENIIIDDVRIDYSVANAPINGTAAGEILVGNDSGSIINALGGNDRIFAGGGNDTVLAGGGDDLIGQNAATGGRDFIDGGANPTAAGDRVIIEGDDSVEAYVVYTVADAIAAGIAVLNAATEIVITRNGAVIAELDNVEEITINTRGGADTVAASGNFDASHLAYNTITVTGGADDTIDASRLTSAHSLVLNQDGSVAQFAGVGQSLIDSLGRDGLLNLSDDSQGFVGSRQNGMMQATLFTAGHDFGFRSNPMFDRELAYDLAANDFGQALKLHNQALHFDAADYLIS